METLSLILVAVFAFVLGWLACVLLQLRFMPTGGYVGKTEVLVGLAEASVPKTKDQLAAEARRKAKNEAAWKAFMANPTGGWRSMGQGGLIPGNDAGPVINQQLHFDVQAGSWMDEAAVRKAISAYERRVKGL